MEIIRNIFRREKVEGDVGIEIEVEGENLPQVRKWWRVENDGSLRGENGEYVLQRPVSLPEAREALAYLAHRFEEKGSQVAYTGRAGVHVHVNCQELNIIQLYNYMVLYLCLEDLLVKWCGDDREGNLFCLRSGDAEYLLYELTSALEDKEFRRRFCTDQLRYASMNVNALPRYGSLEFRAMRSTIDPDIIYPWTELLLNLRKHAEGVGNPTDIIHQISLGGEEAFLKHYTGPLAEDLMAFVGWKDKLKEGMRRAQEVAFAGDWEALAAVPKRRIGGIEVAKEWDEDFPPVDM